MWSCSRRKKTHSKWEENTQHSVIVKERFPRVSFGSDGGQSRKRSPAERENTQRRGVILQRHKHTCQHRLVHINKINHKHFNSTTRPNIQVQTLICGHAEQHTAGGQNKCCDLLFLTLVVKVNSLEQSVFHLSRPFSRHYTSTAEHTERIYCIFHHASFNH